ncbi:uncharacterized protein [Chelonus insularis]|uniref:uncharacterized protein n=1 Tax=Chelonus insularis TaxID=460826 RepID=UPI00158AF71F|nr:uncharacterized protein LOC118073103 [Chelonus insularis]XP_034949298.1 uncharacterized protein LOC118073108 [Chelonus insularis]
MAHLRLLIVMIIAVFCYVPLAESAAVHAEDFAEKLERIALEVSPEKLQLEHEAKSSVNKLEKHFCDKQPCAWAIYSPLTRDINSYISNTCGCLDKSYKCIRTDDDLSAAAYVYHCRQNITEEDIEAPEEVN